MTKSKVILKNGKTVRIDLHPTKRQIWRGFRFFNSIASLVMRGATLQNRSF